MRRNRKHRISRRTVLRGTGTLLALPWLESLSGAASTAAPATRPKRLVIVGSSYGQYPGAFFPKNSGLDYELSEYLQPLSGLKNHFTVMQGLDHGLGGGHKGVSAWLTGVRYEPGAGNRMYSVDQFAADRIGGTTRYPSLSLSLQSSESVSWNRNGVCLRSIGEPQTLFDLLFRTDGADERRQQHRRLSSDQAVLDVVLQSARDMRGQLGQSDRAKFEEYLNAVDEIEQQLTRSDDWLDREKPDPELLGLSSAPGYADLEANGGLRMASMRGMFDLMALALQTDSSRVISRSASTAQF